MKGYVQIVQNNISLRDNEGKFKMNKKGIWQYVQPY